MKTTIYPYLIVLFGVIISLFGFTACTDEDNIDISYESSINVSAEHIFESFQSTLDDDFKLNGTAGKWNLNLHMFIYDINGNLVDKAEDSYASLSSTLNYKISLDPGKYTIVSIAEFDGTYNGIQYKFWNISNEQYLNNLTIQESETVCSSAMETLGIDVKTIEVSNKTQRVNVDIKPVTGLVEMIIWDDDFSNAGKDGYSFNAPYINDLTIFSQQLKQIVRFEDGEITYDYGIQAARYPMTTHSPRAQAISGASKQSLSYRALLPDNDKRFYWELNTIPGAGTLLFSDGNDFQISDPTDNAVNIESGKQYVMDLVLDAFYLFLEEHNPNIDMFTRLEKHMDTYNKSLIVKPLENRYDKLVGMSKKQIESYLKMEEFYTSGNTVNYFGTGLISFVSVVFEDETFAKSKRIMLTWAIDSKDKYDIVAECLGTMYTQWEKGTTATVKQYINATSFEEATVVISWSSNNYSLYFDSIQR